jgi:hypothetical protein
MTMWNDNEDPPIAAERAELQKLRAEVERLRLALKIALGLDDGSEVGWDDAYSELKRMRGEEPKP